LDQLAWHDRQVSPVRPPSQLTNPRDRRVMKPMWRFLQAQGKWLWPHLNPASLQVRLTVGVAALSLMGLVGVSAWMGWTMRRFLMKTHDLQIAYVAERFPRDLELYSEMMPLDRAFQKTLDKLATPNVALWVQRPNGEIYVQTENFTLPRSLLQQLIDLPELSMKAKVYEVGDRYVLVCGSPLIVNGMDQGIVYVGHDMTQAVLMLRVGLRNLVGITISGVVLIMVATSLFIRRALRPLREMSQMAINISPQDFGKARINLDHAPQEVQELAQTCNNMLARLSESWEKQRQFVSNVSHELRTPLTIVHGYLQSTLRRGQNLTPMQREGLEVAASEAERTVQLLQDLLDLARADNGYVNWQLQPLVLNDLVAEVVNMAEKFSPDRVVQLQLEEGLEDQVVKVRGDRHRLKQVLLNLIDNALKYSGPTAPVTVLLKVRDRQAVVQVIDQGCGIPLQHQSRIFERFYRVDEARARSTGGYGLGLAIVKSLTESMGGTVSVRSQPGQGSVFAVNLPLLQVNHFLDVE